MPAQPKHRISVVVEGQRVDGWTDYEIGSSMVEAVDHFSLKRPFDSDVYRLLVPDSKIKIKIDETVVIDGYIDEREKDSERGGSTIAISGRDKVGHLVQESAPTINYSGELTDVIGRLVKPQFGSVALSDARNRRGRLGRHRIAAGAGEDIVKTAKIKKSWMGSQWRLQPGQAEWKIASELASEAGYMLWSSADGKEVVLGQPDYKQPITFLVCQPDPSSSSDSTALRLNFKESVADRFSLIMALGSGTGNTANYGDSTVTRRDVIRNGPGIDGTGVDFLHPKRLILAERSLKNLDEAAAYCQKEMDRRDFHKLIVTCSMPAHGQVQGDGTIALYSPNTLARVIDDEQDLPLDGAFLIFSCKFHGKREEETTELQLVPRGTKFAL